MPSPWWSQPPLWNTGCAKALQDALSSTCKEVPSVLRPWEPGGVWLRVGKTSPVAKSLFLTAEVWWENVLTNAWLAVRTRTHQFTRDLGQISTGNDILALLEVFLEPSGGQSPRGGLAWPCPQELRCLPRIQQLVQRSQMEVILCNSIRNVIIFCDFHRS